MVQTLLQSPTCRNEEEKEARHDADDIPLLCADRSWKIQALTSSCLYLLQQYNDHTWLALLLAGFLNFYHIFLFYSLAL